MNVVAIIQARMASSRLPGKGLKEIVGRPMLWHIINRVEKSKYINKIIVATTKDKKDDQIEEFAIKYNIGIYRGSENDIVDRFYNAAKNYNVDIIVRIWGDCPLIDPAIIDKTMKEFLSNQADYANNFYPPTFPFGMNVEVYTFKTLEKIWKDTNDRFYREYPFEYIYENQISLKTIFVKNDIDLSHIHWTVDYIEDFIVVTKIYKKLYKKNKVFHMADILNVIKKNSELRSINEGLKRNIEYYKELNKTHGS